MRNGPSPDNLGSGIGSNDDRSTATQLIGQLEVAEERIEELERQRARQERITAKVRRDTVAETSKTIQNQLSYRYGKQLLKALRNPLLLFILPINLVREWRAFRIASQTRVADPIVEEESLPEPRAKPGPIPDEVVRELSVNELTALKERRLTRHIREASQEGDLVWAARLAAARLLTSGAVGSAHALRRTRGQLVELNPSWLPPIQSKRLSDIVDNRVLHIFKTIYPLESTGGAVRNWSVVKHQHAIGIQPIVAVTPDDLPREIVGHNGGKDGLFAINRSDVEIWFCQLAQIDRAKIPRDTLLSFDTELLARIVDQTKVSLVHATSGFRGYDTALKGLALAESRDLPFVYEVRSFHEHTWRSLVDGVLDMPMTKLRAAQEDRCMAEADAVVTISEAMAAELVVRGVDRSRLFVVPNSIDEHFLASPDPDALTRFRNQWQLNGQTVVGYISNISRREGHEVLIRGFTEVYAQRNDVRLLIVGDGPQKADLEALVDELEIADAVIFTGSINHTEIVAAYAAIDVFVVPRLEDYASDYVTPMKPIEAMAIGCSLIMSDRPVSHEILGDGDRGLLFKTGDPADLARTITSVITDKAAAEERSTKARKWVEDHRRWSNTIHQYSEIYATARRHHENKKAAH